MLTEKRLIDANALRAVLKKEECDCEVFPWAVDNAPTVDAVEVIRCKDCKHKADVMGGGNYLCNRKMHGVVRPSDFCSFGEREIHDGR